MIIGEYKITLKINSHNYKLLAKTISEHRKTIQQLKIHAGIRDSLLRDIRLVQNILEKAEVIPKIREEVQDGKVA